MKHLKRIVIVFLVLMSLESLYSCGNARWVTDAGLNVTWGPNGPRVRPHVDFDIYNGGRLGR